MDALRMFSQPFLVDIYLLPTKLYFYSDKIFSYWPFHSGVSTGGFSFDMSPDELQFQQLAWSANSWLLPPTASLEIKYPNLILYTDMPSFTGLFDYVWLDFFSLYLGTHFLPIILLNCHDHKNHSSQEILYLYFYLKDTKKARSSCCLWYN